MNNYRPNVGETIFASFVNEQPILITIQKYFNDSRIRSEEFTYLDQKGRVKDVALENVFFYPDAPIDSKYIYVATLEESEFMGRSNSSDLAFFFLP